MKRDAWPFLLYAHDKCAGADVQLHLLMSEMTPEGDLGIFDDIKMKLVACMRNADWPETLAHELSHLDQMLEGSPLWKTINPDVDDFEAWIRGEKKLSPQKLRATVRSIQKCELDCERRTLRLIKKFRLTEDIVGYIKRANITIWSYEIARKHKKRWYEIDEKHTTLWNAVPSRLMRMTDIGKMPADVETLLAAHTLEQA